MLYKNTEAQITHKFRAIKEQYQAGCKNPKRLQGEEIEDKLNTQAQKKGYNKIRSMPSKSSAAT